MKTTVREAKATKIFVISQANEIEETNLYDFVIESEDITTTPRGVAPRVHIRQNNELSYDLWTWGVNGNHPACCERDFAATEEEADDKLFNLVYDYDFSEDDQRDTWFVYTYDEAIQCWADRNDMSLDAAKSYMHHKQIATDERAKREAIANARREASKTEAFEKYKNAIEFIEGENYKQTCNRLSAAIGEKIDGGLFHRIVKKIRENAK